jgi:hypothetical protein
MKTVAGVEVGEAIQRLGNLVHRELNGDNTVPPLSYILIVGPFSAQPNPADNICSYVANMSEQDIYMVLKTQLAVMEGRYVNDGTFNPPAVKN